MAISALAMFSLVVAPLMSNNRGGALSGVYVLFSVACMVGERRAGALWTHAICR
jgi:hypothetical protein